MGFNSALSGGRDLKNWWWDTIKCLLGGGLYKQCCSPNHFEKKWEYPYISVLLHLDSSPFWPPPWFLNHMIKQNLREDTQIMSEWVKSRSRVRLFATPWTVAHQVPLSMGFSRQEYWSGLPFPSPGESSQPRHGIHVSCMDRQILYQLSHKGSPYINYTSIIKHLKN